MIGAIDIVVSGETFIARKVVSSMWKTTSHHPQGERNFAFD